MKFADSDSLPTSIECDAANAPDGSRIRADHVLLTRDEWEALKHQRDREEAAEQDSAL